MVAFHSSYDRPRAASGQSSVNVDLEWVEENGPAVSPTPRKGFGSRLLVASASQMNAELKVDHAREGLRCRLCFRVPLPNAQDSD